MLRLHVGFQSPNSASVLGCSPSTCAECPELLALEIVACSISAALPRAAKEGTENCCFSMCFSAQGYLILELMLKMSLVRQEKCKTAVGAYFSYLLHFPPLFSLLLSLPYTRVMN